MNETTTFLEDTYFCQHISLGFTCKYQCLIRQNVVWSNWCYTVSPTWKTENSLKIVYKSVEPPTWVDVTSPGPSLFTWWNKQCIDMQKQFETKIAMYYLCVNTHSNTLICPHLDGWWLMLFTLLRRMPWRPSFFFEHHKKSFRRSKPWAKKLPSKSPTKGAVERATWKLKDVSFRGICFTPRKVESDSCRFDVATKPFWMFVAFCKSWFTSSKGEPTSGFEELPRKTWTELASCEALVAGSGTTTFWRRSPGKGWKMQDSGCLLKISMHICYLGLAENGALKLVPKNNKNRQASKPSTLKSPKVPSRRHLKAFLPPSRSSDSLGLRSDLIVDPPCYP